MRKAAITLVLPLLAACEPFPRIELYPSTAEARDRPYPELVPVEIVEAAGGPPKLREAEAVALEERAESLTGAAAAPAAVSAEEIARAEALREEAAEARAAPAAPGDDLRARAEALRERTECEGADALPPCPAPDS